MDSRDQAEAPPPPRRSARLRRLRGSTTRLSDVHVHPTTIANIEASIPHPAAVAAAEAAAAAAGTQTSDAVEEIEEDDLCPICQLLLYRPVKTRCNHTLCEFCMAHWADVSVTSQMKIVDVDEKPVDFDPVLDLEAKCPMCRTQTSASSDLERARLLQGKYPREWATRKSEEETDHAARDGGAGSVQTITVYVGNRHKLVVPDDGGENEHEWTFFAKPSRTDIIEEVQILLHPTFKPNRIVRTRAPYNVRRWGWGTFTITAYVILKAGFSWVSEDAADTPDGARKGMLPLEWTLDFDGFNGKGSMGRCRLKVKNDREWGDPEHGAEARADEADFQRMRRHYQRDGDYVPPPED